MKHAKSYLKKNSAHIKKNGNRVPSLYIHILVELKQLELKTRNITNCLQTRTHQKIIIIVNIRNVKQRRCGSALRK